MREGLRSYRSGNTDPCIGCACRPRTWSRVTGIAVVVIIIIVVVVVVIVIANTTTATQQQHN